jgi:hypothetical protein
MINKLNIFKKSEFNCTINKAMKFNIRMSLALICINKHGIVAMLMASSIFVQLPILCISIKNIPSLSAHDARMIGEQIWRNECNKSINGLTTWNKAESFASLGIGHFIWFPRVCSAHFTQTFPALMLFFKRKDVVLPQWLITCEHCPWNSYEEFIAALATKHMQELRTLLSTTVESQVLFMVERMQNALPAMIKNKPRRMREAIKKQFYRVAQTTQGLYVLIDYINFKGEGTNIKERYNGQGWGLLQVLERMYTLSDGKSDLKALDEFAAAAADLLTMRVHNAPNKEIEERFLTGWLNRVKTYTRNIQ